MKKLLIVLILFFSYTTYSQTAEEYYNSGYEKYENKDYENAIADFTKAIKIDPGYVDAYNYRGNSKRDLKDDYGSIKDYNKDLKELKPCEIVRFKKFNIEHIYRYKHEPLALCLFEYIYFNF